MIKVAIIGGSGLTGRELIKILSKHKEAKIRYVTSLEYPGVPVIQVFPGLKGMIDGNFLNAEDEKVYSGVDLAFICLPHGAAMTFVGRFAEKGVKVIDLSADFRIKDPGDYKKWYNKEHAHKELLDEAVYGLPELYRKEIKKARIIANPGCYPTSILLGVIPFIEKNEVESIIIDAKSGISGAGINPTPFNNYMNVSENVIPYNIGRKHRHLGEIEDVLKRAFKANPDIIFTPQITAMARGMLSVIYMKVKKWQDPADVKGMYAEFYKDEPFVRVVDKAGIHNVRNTNFCEICVDGVKESRTLIIISVIDNLVKGASGQAVQNMNIMFGFDEKEGLL
jgi:N-acetyl-gamma-glutamyl-phosphate reductase